MNTNNQEMLVSIVLVSYNSSRYIIEALDSIKDQTYQNIELIITDDCSTDDTIDITNKWLRDNKNRFTNSQVITADKNSGIAPNANRGFKAAQGEWIKAIAGDDLLMPECIEKNVNFINSHKTKAVFSSWFNFSGEFNISNVVNPIKKLPIYMNSLITVSEQYQLVLRGKGAPINSLIMERDTFFQIGGFDEEIPFCEDLPLVIKLHKAGIRTDFFNEVTSLHRVHNESVFFSFSNLIYTKWHVKSHLVAIEKYALKELPVLEVVLFKYSKLIALLFHHSFLNNANLITKSINYALLTPCRLYTKYWYNKLIDKFYKRIA